MILKYCKFEDGCKKFHSGTCPLANNGAISDCLKLYIIEKLKDEALLTEEQRKPVAMRLDSSKVDKEAFDRLKVIENNIEKFVQGGNNLYICSKITGNGKTSFSLKLLIAYLERIWYKSGASCRGLFINVPSFFFAMKENFDKKLEVVEHIKKNILSADLIVWDDIATKGLTTFETELLLSYISNRISAGKSNIYTSNTIGQDLRDCVGERLYSRIWNSSEIIVFNGVDKRGVSFS